MFKASKLDLVLHRAQVISHTIGDGSSVVYAPPLPKEPELGCRETDVTAAGSKIEFDSSGDDLNAAEENIPSGATKSCKNVSLVDTSSDTDYEMKQRSNSPRRALKKMSKNIKKRLGSLYQ